MSLVDYLQEKVDAMQAGCTCPTDELLKTLPIGVEVLSECVEHGRKREIVGGFARVTYGSSWRWPWSRR